MNGGDETRMDVGMRIRREVLGSDHVDRSLSQATEFARPVQEFVTETCWSDVWSRPGLDRRTRSLINLSMLTAMNRMHEFEVHVRGAVRNGCTVEEIQEVLLQTAAYCGAPAALQSFRAAERVLRDIGALGSNGVPEDGSSVNGEETGAPSVATQ